MLRTLGPKGFTGLFFVSRVLGLGYWRVLGFVVLV